jgi:class I fructose-bisphosphate aldolase
MQNFAHRYEQEALTKQGNTHDHQGCPEDPQQLRSDNPGVKANLYRMLNQGKLGGTGKMIILPVDQGFEHGPARSFSVNPDAYDPHYHYQLAIDAGLSAYAAPLGMLEAGADKFAGQIPTILKVNSSNSWATAANQALTGSVDDALRLGCSAIGFTIYPGRTMCSR